MYRDDPVMKAARELELDGFGFDLDFEGDADPVELVFLPGKGAAAAPEAPDKTDRQTVDAQPVVTTNNAESPILSVPWGPNVDVLFHPRGTVSFVGGKVVLYAESRGVRAKLSSVTITDASKGYWLTGGAGAERYVVTAQLGSAPASPQTPASVVATSYSGRQGGLSQLNPRLLSLFSGAASTTAGALAKQTMGRVYFDPTKYNPNDVIFRVVLATSDAAEPAFVDLYDEQGITNGGVPTVVAGSQMSTASVQATELEIDLQAIARATSPGIFSVRMWLNPATGGTATLNEAQLEID